MPLISESFEELTLVKPHFNDGWTTSFALFRPLRPDLIEQTDNRA
jgi:hypothetical protein